MDRQTSGTGDRLMQHAHLVIPAYLERAVERVMADPNRVLTIRTNEDAMEALLAEVQREARADGVEPTPSRPDQCC